MCNQRSTKKFPSSLSELPLAPVAAAISAAPPTSSAGHIQASEAVQHVTDLDAVAGNITGALLPVSSSTWQVPVPQAAASGSTRIGGSRVRAPSPLLLEIHEQDASAAAQLATSQAAKIREITRCLL